MGTELSVLIPMKNLGAGIKDVLKSLSDSAGGIKTEYILLDIKSKDDTMVSALNCIKELGLNGRVIQCGNNPCGAVLNSGLSISEGDYTTFIFPRQMYKSFIPEYLEAAESSSADVIFGRDPGTIFGKGLGFSSVKISGQEMFKALLNGYARIDLGALMLKTSFIKDRRVYFDEECYAGYAEEYIYKSLLLAEKICQCGCVLQRDNSFKLPKSDSASEGFACFGKIESLLRTEELLEYCSVSGELKEQFKKEKIPSAVLDCADYLIKRGYDIRTIKKAMKFKGYDKLLAVSSKTNKSIKRAVFKFNHTPWMYKPR